VGEPGVGRWRLEGNAVKPARPVRLRVLTYHRVGVPRGGRTERLTVPPGRFAAQLRWLVRLGFEPSSLDVAPAVAAGQPVGPRRPVVLTFDDGFAEIYDHALPLLAERGVPAVVYVITEARRADMMEWGGQEPPALLAPRQWRELAQAGLTIGSHTRTHPRLTRCSPEQLVDEVAGSKSRLEDEIGCEVRHFCYPYGRWNDAVTEAVRDAGYATACTTERGMAGAGSCLLRLPRLTIGKRMRLLRFMRRVIWG
jgi:peptidoglycan/xylan/chitin deacetylase (PgdA/CDA1 family)